jgi:hypothetical protein
MHFYEISKLVYDMATNDFSYLSNAQGKFQHVIGDARVSLNSIESQQYDLLVIDAFSGDAVPTHLLTLEAMSVYESHIKSDGLIAFHISNNLVDLADPVAALAEAKGMKVILIETPEDPGKLHFKAKWMVCTRDEEFFKYIAELHAGTIYKSPWKSPWTDDNVNIMNVIR